MGNIYNPSRRRRPLSTKRLLKETIVELITYSHIMPKLLRKRIDELCKDDPFWASLDKLHTTSSRLRKLRKELQK